MQFNDTSGLSGVIQEVERLTDLGSAVISGDATQLKIFTAIANNKNRRIWATIFRANGNWQYDDGNKTDLPSSITNLSSGSRDYALPSDALTVNKVTAKDSSGNQYVLKPITVQMLNEAPDEFYETSGQPVYYSLVGNTIKLYPAPNYNSTGGLKIYFDRDVFDFTTSDTTKTPGFASPFHALLPLKMAIDWLSVKEPTSPRLANYRNDEAKMEADLIRFYSTRFKDLKPAVTRKKERWS